MNDEDQNLNTDLMPENTVESEHIDEIVHDDVSGVDGANTDAADDNTSDDLAEASPEAEVAAEVEGILSGDAASEEDSGTEVATTDIEASVADDVGSTVQIEGITLAVPVKKPIPELSASDAIDRVMTFLSQMFCFATVDGDQPRVRPFSSAALHDGKVYFATKRSKSVYNQLIANPKFEIFATLPDEGFLRVSGRAVESKDEVVNQSVMATSNIYATGTDTAVFHIETMTGEVDDAHGLKAKVNL